MIIKIFSDMVKNRQTPAFNKWKIYAIAYSKTLQIQKLVRGFIARRRVKFMLVIMSYKYLFLYVFI